MKIALFITKVSQYFCNPLTITQRSLVRKKSCSYNNWYDFFSDVTCVDMLLLSGLNKLDYSRTLMQQSLQNVFEVAY